MTIIVSYKETTVTSTVNANESSVTKMAKLFFVPVSLPLLTKMNENDPLILHTQIHSLLGLDMHVAQHPRGQDGTRYKSSTTKC